MSSVPSPESVEETKQQIRGLISEIADLSRGDVPAEEYFPAVLKRIVDALAAIGGAIWLLDDSNQMRLGYHINVNSELLEADNEDAQKHARLLSRLMARGKSELVPPHSMLGEDQQEGNPSQYLLIVAPLTSGKQASGLVEVFQRPDSSPNIQRGYMRFLDQMAGLIGEWLKGHHLQKVADRQVMWQQADHFARMVHDNLDRRDTAYTIANEGRQLIGCDRVSVAILRGRKCKVEAISGQDSIEGRSNIVTALNKLATRVVAAGQSLWYDGRTEELPPQLEEAVEEYVDLSHGRSIVVLPIRRPEKLITGDVQSKQKVQREDTSKNEIIGALIVEQIESQISTETLRTRCDLVYEHAARALSNSISHSDLFLMPLWKFLSRLTWLFRGSAFPKTMTVLSLLTVGLLAMFLVRIQFNLKANGVLKPLVERQVFSHENGEIEQVLVDHGDTVVAGQPLVILRNRELEVEYKRLQGELEQTLEQSLVTTRMASSRDIPLTDRTQASGQVEELKIRKATLTEQLKLIDERREQLIRRSPINGVVMDWKLKERLRARPVVVGQVLVNVADTTQDWELELMMPEKRMKHMDDAVLAQDRQPLDVSFVLASDPSVYHTGKLPVQAIHARAQLDTTDGPVVKMRVQPDEMSKLTRRPNTTVIAKVNCGRRSAAFVWFHEVVEWFQANVLFRL
ncbi:MAG: biotin/lipoyl-binding protein [Pirellulaceae bacterium]|nr:biotin/lipoyl-binding protein [Pirellulaceae bacterium]